jgi:hypothetical protein
VREVRHDDLQGTPLHAVVGLGQYKYQEFIPNSPTLASRAMPPETGLEMTEAGRRAPLPRAGSPWWDPAACGTWTPPVATSGGWICRESQGSRAAPTTNEELRRAPPPGDHTAVVLVRLTPRSPPLPRPLPPVQQLLACM